MGVMDIIPSTAPKSLTNDTTFSNYLLIVDAYSKIPKLYGMELEKLTNLAGGIWKEYQQMQVRSLTRRSSKRNVKLAEFI